LSAYLVGGRVRVGERVRVRVRVSVRSEAHLPMSPPHLPHISPISPHISRGTAAELARHRRVAGCGSAAAAAAALTEGRSAAELQATELGETDAGGRVLPSRELLRWASAHAHA